MKFKLLMAAIAVCNIVSGCAQVSLTQRGNLASADMQWESDPSVGALAEHVYTSKEAASGGRATGGGGCGCK